MTRLLILMINIYQKMVSPIIGPRCRFYPSCSSYAKETIELNGPLFGIIQTIKRVGRCHPFSVGGVDFPTKKGAKL